MYKLIFDKQVDKYLKKQDKAIAVIIMGGGTLAIALLKFTLFLASGVVLFIVFHNIMRRLLKIKEEKIYNYYFKKHENIDRTFIVSAGIIPLMGYVSNSSWITQLWFISFVLLIFCLIIHAIMAFKYAEDPNVYKIIISHIIFYAVFFLAMFSL